jgi:hypothetical protein
MEKKFLSERELEEIGIQSRSKSRNDRWRGVGLPYVKLGRCVRYRIEDVERYINDHSISTREF